ncbi:MAG TPA: amidohydrolase [Steroidobacteraceae bacterium]
MAVLAGNAVAADGPRDAGQAVPELATIQPEIEALYRDLHQHPELSFHEVRTADALATRMEALGYEVTTGVGKTGIVALLRNGPGPVVMLRTELDALPVEEKTGLAFASKVTTRNDAGETVPVAHACGHDLHMAGWYGTAEVMAARRKGWHGTLMLVGQPAEEVAGGAEAMLADGLFTRFPKPDFVIGMHDEASLPSGLVGYHAGYFRASADALEVTIYGRGGHGAYPHTAVDPIVIAARAILGFQTIVSRETNPLSPAVVTVGAIHAGTAGNIIPDQVRMLMTVRAFDPKVREHLLASIKRQLDAEATAADAPAMPVIKMPDHADVVYNDPTLTAHLARVLSRDLGPDSVREMPAQMGAEDFSQYGRAGVRAVLLHIGAVDPADLASGKRIPGLHSPQWAPQLEPTLRSLVAAEVVMLTDLLAGGADH